MPVDSSIFAAQFSSMFNDFVKQQLDFQKKIEKVFGDISKTLEGKKKSETVKKYENENQQKYLEGRPENVQKTPRKVVEDVTKVTIADISEKAAKKIDSDDDSQKNAAAPEPKGGGSLIEKVLGTLLMGVTAVAGGFALNSMGIDTSALSAVFGVAGGIFSKMLKKLPLVGLLISVGEAISKFKSGGPKNIISGLLDIAAGISYMFPGIGTAIGLGIDVLNYFFEKTVDQAEEEGKSVETFGDIFTIVKDAILNSKFIKWFKDLGKKFIAIFTASDGNERIIALYDYFEHIGLVWLGEMFNKLDEGIGGLLGLEDENGAPASLTGWLTNWVSEKIVTPIMNFFSWIGEKIMNAITSVIDGATEMFNKAKEWVKDKLNPLNWLRKGKEKVEEVYDEKVTSKVNTLAGNDAAMAEIGMDESGKTSADKNADLYKALSNQLKEEYDLTDENLKPYKTGSIEERIEKLTKLKQDLKAQKEAENNLQADPETFNDDKLKPLDDFVSFGGNTNAIVMGGKYQKFSEDDTVIGFKDGEALAKGIEQLIEVGQQQLEILSEYLEKAAGVGNVVAPSTTNNYSFSVESGVSAFRKAVN